MDQTSESTPVFEVARSRIRENSGRFAVRQLPRFRPKSGDFGYFSSKRATSKTPVEPRWGSEILEVTVTRGGAASPPLTPGYDVQPLRGKEPCATRSNLFRLASILWLAASLLPSTTSAQDDVAALEEQALKAAVARVAPSVLRIETIGGLEQVERVLVGTTATTG